jgi:hypothetical protein
MTPTPQSNLACAELPDYPDYVARLRSTESELAEEIAEFPSVTGVLDWMKPRGLASAQIDMVGMDEFEYDFLIQLEPGGRWLVFGVT